MKPSMFSNLLVVLGLLFPTQAQADHKNYHGMLKCSQIHQEALDFDQQAALIKTVTTGATRLCSEKLNSRWRAGERN